MQAPSHPELHDFEIPDATSLDDSAEELVRRADSMSDHELGVIKEGLERAGLLDLTMNAVAAIMSTNEEVAADAFRVLHFCYRHKTQQHIRNKTKQHVRSSDSQYLHDLTQECWCCIWQYHDSFEAGRPFTPWMWTIVNRRILDWLEKWFRQWSKLDDIEDHLELAESVLAAEDSDRLVALSVAIDRLPPKQRTIIQMHCIKERPLPQVAETMGLSVSQVKIQKSRALQTLRRLLNQPASLKRSDNPSR